MKDEKVSQAAAGYKSAETRTGRKITKAQAGFMEGRFGPFECGRCRHFDSAAQACERVEGTIDADDCCNLFWPKAAKTRRA